MKKKVNMKIQVHDLLFHPGHLLVMGNVILCPMDNGNLPVQAGVIVWQVAISDIALMVDSGLPHHVIKEGKLLRVIISTISMRDIQETL